jgi:hypothetical protein
MNYQILAKTKKIKFLKEFEKDYYLVIIYNNLKPKIKTFRKFGTANEYFKINQLKP